MRPDVFSTLALSLHRFRLRALEPVSLPDFLGSTLRGAFGHALKAAVCVMPHRDCARCLVAERCTYPYLFETPSPQGLSLLRGQRQAPHPFVLSALPFDAPRVSGAEAAVPARGNAREDHSPFPNPVRGTLRAGTAFAPSHERRVAEGDEVSFDLLLLGRAVECLPYVVHAVGEMARRGLGANRARFTLDGVSALDERGVAQTIYSHDTRRLAVSNRDPQSLCDFVCARLEQLPDAPSLKLRFHTPTRIRVEGDLQSGLSFGLLTRNILRRLSLLSAVHGSAPLTLDFRTLVSLADGVEARSSALRWHDWERYSNRQNAKMKLGGFVGSVEYAGEALRDFLPLLAAGEILHVGAGTSFGLGRYEIL